MKSFLLFIGLIISFISFTQKKSSSDIQVKGYTRSNGTYVAPHYRTVPNSTNIDNFSTLGNTNPYTGKVGTITPDRNSIDNNNSLTGDNLISIPSNKIVDTELGKESEEYKVAFWKGIYKEERQKLLRERNKKLNNCNVNYHEKGLHWETLGGKVFLKKHTKSFKCDFCNDINKFYIINVEKYDDKYILYRLNSSSK